MRRQTLIPLILSLFAASAQAGDLDELLRGVPSKAKVGVHAVELSSGRVLASHDADAPLRPASNMKVVTLALAFERLGADAQHLTRVVLRGELRGATLHGDVIVIGGGDPTISRRFEGPGASDIDVPQLSEWAQMLKRRGIREVTGDIVADDRMFERVGFHPDWEEGDRNRYYAAEVSALSLNDNCIDIEIDPDGPKVRTIPPSSYVDLTARLASTSSSKEHVWGVSRSPGTNAVLVRGTIWSRGQVQRTEITVTDPALYFVTSFKDSLARAGLTVRGGARRIRAGEEVDGEVIVEHRTPLTLSAAICGKRSINHYAESLLKAVAHKVKGEGTWEAGRGCAEAFLEELGAPMAGLVVRDGSGLSRRNQLSAKALTTLLAKMAERPWAATFQSSLALGGVDGTLARRLRDLPAGWRVQAKTGTLRDTSALSGYLIKDGERPKVIAFSLLMNDCPGSRSLQDRMVRALCD